MTADLHGASERWTRDEAIAAIRDTVKSPIAAEFAYGVALFDSDGTMLAHNKQVLRLSDLSKGETEGDPSSILASLVGRITDETRDALVHDVVSRTSADPSSTRVVSYTRHDGGVATSIITVLRSDRLPGDEPVYLVYSTPEPTRDDPEPVRFPAFTIVIDERLRVVHHHAAIGSIAGLSIWPFVHPDDVLIFFDAVDELLAGHATEAIRTTRVLTRARASTSIEWRLQVLVGAGGQRHIAMNTVGSPPTSALRDPTTTLSPREREVFDLVVDRVHLRAIALRLGVAESTVRNLLARVRKKLGVRDTAQLFERYNPRFAYPRRVVGSRIVGFRAGVERARAAHAQTAPVFVHASGTRDEWIATLGDALHRVPMTMTDVGVAVAADARIVASNAAFDRFLGRSSSDTSFAEFGRDDEIEARIAEGADVPGTWWFNQRSGNLLLQCSIVRRDPYDGPVYVMYLSRLGVAAPKVSTARGWMLVDDELRMQAGGLEGTHWDASMPIGVGNPVWLYFHPETLTANLADAHRVLAGEVDELDFVGDGLHVNGWGLSYNRLRGLVGPDGPLIHWEFARSFGGTTLRADPARLPLADTDLAIALPLLDGASIADLAVELGLARGTVRNRISRIYRTLGVANRAELLERYR